MSTIAERVARGAAMFDEELPGWWAVGRIDLTKLRMASGCDCVVGQMWEPDEDDDGDYDGFTDALRHDWLDLDLASAKSFGLFAENHWDDARQIEYDELTAEWRRVITERRAAA